MQCYVCNEEIEDVLNAHWVHEPDCANPEECDCDLTCHPDCCPVCCLEDRYLKARRYLL
jgi:hypothetical protein